MADYLSGEQSPYLIRDFENPSPAAANVNVRPRNIVKLALELTAVACVIALGVVLGKNRSSDEPKIIQAASSASSVSSVIAENNESGKATKSFKQEPNMVPSSITYETCSDLEKDITEALTLYINNYISIEAETKEMYANCVPLEVTTTAVPYEVTTPTPAKKTAAKALKLRARPSNRRDVTKRSNKDKRTSRSERNRKSKSGKKSGSKRSGDADHSGFEQNSRNENVTEGDKVVSDGKFIYAAHEDVLQVWSADGSIDGVSITQMSPDAINDRKDVRDYSTHVPWIQDLFLSNGRLTVVVSPDELADYDIKLAVRVYDVSDVKLGSPLNELARKELLGTFLDAGSIGNGDKIMIATDTYFGFWFQVTEDISRWHPQYCGLNTTAYIELAKSTAESLSLESIASQIITKLDLYNDCSGIFQVSTMQDSCGVNAPGLTGFESLFDFFVRLYTLDVSSANGDITATVAGSFSSSYDNSVYRSEDFTALILNIDNYNIATNSSDHWISILGFGLSADDDLKPSSFAHIHTLGPIYSGNYRMQKKEAYLRVLLTMDGSAFSNDWIPAEVSKIYVLELPSTPGAMSLVGESKSLFSEDGNQYFTSSFSRDLAFLSTHYYYSNASIFVVVDLLDPSSPKPVDFDLLHLEEIDVNGTSYILGIGSQLTTYYQSSVVLALIDISTPSEPKLAAYHKSETGSCTEADHDFLSIRYFNGSLIIPVSTDKYSEMTYNNEMTSVFVVYDISETAITPLFNVTHLIENNNNCCLCYCWNYVPPRSFVINSELTTIKGFTAVRTDMAGNVLAEVDLDEGFNYSDSGCPKDDDGIYFEVRW